MYQLKVENSGFLSVSAGSFTSFAIKADGDLWVWGPNNYGQIGDGTQTDRNTPALFGSD